MCRTFRFLVLSSLLTIFFTASIAIKASLVSIAATQAPTASEAALVNLMPAQEKNYDLKVVRVEGSPTAFIFEGSRYSSASPSNTDHIWLVVTVEITSLDAKLTELTVDSKTLAVIDAKGNRFKLHSAGVATQKGEDFAIALMDGGLIIGANGFFISANADHAFSLPTAKREVLIASKLRGGVSVVGLTGGTEWQLGGLDTKANGQFALLFEVPVGTTDLRLEVPGLPAISLAQPQTGVQSPKQVQVFTSSMTSNEIVQMAALYHSGRKSADTAPTSSPTARPTRTPTPTSVGAIKLTDGKWRGRGSAGGSSFTIEFTVEGGRVLNMKWEEVIWITLVVQAPPLPKSIDIKDNAFELRNVKLMVQSLTQSAQLSARFVSPEKCEGTLEIGNNVPIVISWSAAPMK